MPELFRGEGGERFAEIVSGLKQRVRHRHQVGRHAFNGTFQPEFVTHFPILRG